MRWTALILALPLVAQQQPTFHAAWQDGLEAERNGRWAEALAAFRRAVQLRPAPAPRIIIYGNNLLLAYYPRVHMARCLVELGDLNGAEAELQKADREPVADREAVMHRIRDLRARELARPSPNQPEREALPSPPHPSPAPIPPALPPKESLAPTREAPAADPPFLAPEDPAALSESIRNPGFQPAPSKPPAEARKAPSAPPLQAPATEPPRPLPWLSMGLGAGFALLAAWAWAMRSARRVRPNRRVGGRPSSFSPGALPESVGPYRIERLLGRGGFSNTFLAKHEGSGQEVALKVPHLHRADDAEFRERFYQEARLGARLVHPHLVRIMDPGQETGRPYLAMEYLPGRTLEERLAQEEPLPIEESVRIALGVAQAMAHAHTHGVVHRDLKPGNVMLTDQGPKVMDLGIARVMDAATVTSTYAFLGTPLYAAPEAQFKTHVGPAADRYSFGVILFHMLAGEPPFQGETPFEILNRHRSDIPPDLATLRPGVPAALSRLVTRLLDKEPDQRPEDSEILRLLGEVADSLSAPSTVTPLD
jgi:hypothetical protein